jgi:hypothetical protein
MMVSAEPTGSAATARIGPEAVPAAGSMVVVPPTAVIGAGVAERRALT